MERIEFKLPDLGEGVAEGEIVAWHIRVGDTVDEDQPMVEVMTDKATVTIGAPQAAVIDEVRGEAGDVVAVGTVLVVLRRPSSRESDEAESNELDDASRIASFASEERAATAVGDLAETLPGIGYFGASKSGTSPATHTRIPTQPMLSDLVTEPVRMAGISTGNLSADSLGGTESHARQPLAGVRRRIAERMEQSTRTAAHFTFVEECDVGRLEELRARLNRGDGRRLTILPFIAKAVVRALSRYPQLNSMLDEEARELVTARHCHLGVAVAGEHGLMVPVVRHAERYSILELSREIETLSHAVREGTIRAADLTGSTFTISSLGARGGLLATPILNYPEVGILGVHRIRERPVVREGHIVIGQILNLSLSMDHRVVDGQVGAAFAYEVIRYLENPDELLIELR